MQRQELLKPSGPYTVGTHKVDLFDANRTTMVFSNGQLIPVLIYFPTQKGEHKPHPKIFDDRVPKVFPPLECKVYSQEQPFSKMLPGNHPIVLFNHAHHAAMTDYGCILEDLASYGYVVVALQSQLDTDPREPSWSDHSISKYTNVVDNTLFVFNWLQENQSTIFQDNLDLSKIALLGHSMGGNALLFMAHRTTQMFQPTPRPLLPHKKTQEVCECIIVMDSGFAPPQIMQIPTLFCLAEERKAHQQKLGTLEFLKQSGYSYSHYPGSKHVSFMDHAWVLDHYIDAPEVSTFNGGLEDRRTFYKSLRTDIRSFLTECGVST